MDTFDRFCCCSWLSEGKPANIFYSCYIVGRNYFTPSPTTPEGRQRSGSRKMLSPRLLPCLAPGCGRTLFCAVKRLPAMLLHSGFADHPHNRFDILVAAPRHAADERAMGRRRRNRCCLSGRSAAAPARRSWIVSRSRRNPADDLPFLGGALDYSVTTGPSL
ncbi:Aminodeoxychorismate synthase component 1 [Klebsiella pneumoniae]|nr:Aminodeoxychorismate synthase component 1 [Klebsiella pneumoniae]